MLQQHKHLNDLNDDALEVIASFLQIHQLIHDFSCVSKNLFARMRKSTSAPRFYKHVLFLERHLCEHTLPLMTRLRVCDLKQMNDAPKSLQQLHIENSGLQHLSVAHHLNELVIGSEHPLVVQKKLSPHLQLLVCTAMGYKPYDPIVPSIVQTCTKLHTIALRGLSELEPCLAALSALPQLQNVTLCMGNGIRTFATNCQVQQVHQFKHVKRFQYQGPHFDMSKINAPKLRVLVLQTITVQDLLHLRTITGLKKLTYQYFEPYTKMPFSLGIPASQNALQLTSIQLPKHAQTALEICFPKTAYVLLNRATLSECITMTSLFKLKRLVISYIELQDYIAINTDSCNKPNAFCYGELLNETSDTLEGELFIQNMGKQLK